MWEDNKREWLGLEFAKSQWAVDNREKWRKLVAKLSVVPQRPSRFRDWWWWWLWWWCFCVPPLLVCLYWTRFTSVQQITFFNNFVNSYFRVFSFYISRNRELRTQKLKSHLVRAQSLNVLLLKPGVGKYIAMHATLTASDFFLAYIYPSGPFTCIFSKSSPDFSCVGCGLHMVPV